MDYSHPPHHRPHRCHGFLREQFTSSGYGAKFHNQTQFTGDGFLQPGSKMNPQLQNSRFLGEWARLGKTAVSRGAVGVWIRLQETNVNLYHFAQRELCVTLMRRSPRNQLEHLLRIRALITTTPDSK